jgi:hypothetical protein
VLGDRSLHLAQLCLVWRRRRNVDGRRKIEFSRRMQRERRPNGSASDSRRKKRPGRRPRRNAVGQKRPLV